MRSAVLAIEIAFGFGLVASAAQIWVVREAWRDWRAVKRGVLNGSLHRIARWAAFITPLVLGLFLFMTFLAFIGIQAGPPVVQTTFGIILRWSYTVIMAVCVAWSVGDLLVRRGLK